MTNLHLAETLRDQERCPHVVVWPSSTCLVTELLSELSQITRAELERTVVILPTQRLCNLVLASLATKLGAFIPPKIQTLEQFIAEQSALVNTPLVTTGDLDAEFILTELIAEKKYQEISKDHAAEILQVFKEVISEHIAPSCFANLRDKLRDDFSKSEEKVASLLTRCEELDDLRESFFQLLRSMQSELFPEFLRRSALNLTADWQKKGYPYGRTYLLGFTSFSAAVLGLVTFVAAEEKSQLWISKSPLLLSKTWPLDSLRKRFGSATDKSEVLTSEEAPRLVPIHACRNKFTEVASCLRRVAEEITSGVPPSQIAILLTSEHEYGPLLRSLISRSEWTPNFAVSIKFAQTPIGRFVRSLVELFKQDESSGAVVDFLANPLTRAWFVSAGAECGVSESLTEAIIRTGISEGMTLMTERLKDPALQTWMLRLSEQLYPIRDLEDKSIHEASLIIAEFLNRFSYLGGTEWEDLAGVRESCNETLEAFWKSIATVYGPTGSFPSGEASSLWQLINAKLLTADVRGVGEPLYGVQVLSLSEARFVPFRRVFVLGCSEGNLPKSLPQDDLLDDYLKRSLGLSGWRNLIALEETTVMLLRDRLERLELFYSTERVGDLAVRSRYIDQFIVDESAVLVSECAEEPRREELLDVDATARVEGRVTSFHEYLKTISATSLEKLLHCPYRFLLSQLRVEALQIPEENDPRLQGQWLHEVAEHFFYELPKAAPPEEFTRVATGLLSQLTTKFAPRGFQNTWLHHHLEHFSWPRFAEHIGSLFFSYPDNTYLRGEKEIRFGPKAPAWDSRISIGPYEFAVKGAVDSIDYFNKFNLITDYKRKSVPTPASIQQGLNPQLGFYLLALLNARRPDLEAFQTDHVIAGYWSILEGIWLPAFSGESLKSLPEHGGVTKKSTPTATAVLEQITKLWTWRLTEVANEKRFYADPSRCELCTLAGACRRDEPSERERLLTQRQLQNFLKASPKGIDA
jgi:hypothetical protein